MKHPYQQTAKNRAKQERKDNLIVARIKAHDVFDPLWKSGEMTRSEAYKWLSKELGVDRRDCHISNFDSRQCKIVMRVVALREQGYTLMRRVKLNDEPEETEEAPDCDHCDGTGIGMSGPVDESKCIICRGRGYLLPRDEDE